MRSGGINRAIAFLIISVLLFFAGCSNKQADDPLDLLIGECLAIDADIYTADSSDSFVEAIVYAQSVSKSGSKGEKQAAESALKTAKESLVLSGSTEELFGKYDLYSGYKSFYFTYDSFSSLNGRLTAAKSIIDQPRQTQVTIDAVLADLNIAADGLEFSQVVQDFLDVLSEAREQAGRSEQLDCLVSQYSALELYDICEAELQEFAQSLRDNIDLINIPPAKILRCIRPRAFDDAFPLCFADGICIEDTDFVELDDQTDFPAHFDGDGIFLAKCISSAVYRLNLSGGVYIVFDGNGLVTFAYDAAKGNVVNQNNRTFGKIGFNISLFDSITVDAGSYLLIVRGHSDGYGEAEIEEYASHVLAKSFHNSIKLIRDDADVTEYINCLPQYSDYCDLTISGRAVKLSQIDFLLGISIVDDDGVFDAFKPVSADSIRTDLSSLLLSGGYLVNGDYQVVFTVNDSTEPDKSASLTRRVIVNTLPQDNYILFSGNSDGYIRTGANFVFNTAAAEEGGYVSLYDAGYWNSYKSNAAKISTCIGGAYLIFDGSGIVRVIYSRGIIHDSTPACGREIIAHIDCSIAARSQILADGEYIMFVQLDAVFGSGGFAESILDSHQCGHDFLRIEIAVSSLELSIACADF